MRSRRRLPIEELAPYLVPDAPKGEDAATLDWPTLFGNAHPVEIEVGFGKGLFFLNAAAARPNINFFGIEIVRKCQLYTATRLASRRLANVKLACADARSFLDRCVPRASIEAVHVYFPDPWWKHRHRKRRLFTLEFAGSVAQVLRPGGTFHIVTDVEDYFQIMTHVVAESGQFHTAETVPPTGAAHDLDYLTNFERKFRKEGRPIYRAAFAKGAGSI